MDDQRWPEVVALADKWIKTGDPADLAAYEAALKRWLSPPRPYSWEWERRRQAEKREAQ